MALNLKKSRAVLLLALAFRVSIALRSSYLHPDEHMQGPQEIAHGIFGWATQLPWEFRPENAVRSFVPLWLIYGIPMRFFDSNTNPVYVLYTLRILFMALTWILEDMAINRLAPTRNDKVRCMLFVSTSYATLTWQAHTLSNSFETILLLWFLVILFEAESVTSAPFRSWFDRHYDNFVLGIITVLGVFNRPTFLAFLVIPSIDLLKLWIKFPGTFFTFAFSAGLVLAITLRVDTLLYGGSDNQWPVLTPLNFILYNLGSDNLSEHGLHSRFTHLLVNLPVLMGPGLLLLRPNWKSLAMKSAIGGLVLLSLVPHQEARFLLPIVPLLCSQMELDFIKSSKLRKTMMNLWLAFNIVMAIMMGFFHQAGVVPAQFYIRELPRPSTVIWWKTYTPPLWVMGLQSEQVDYLALDDLYGVTVDDVTSKLSNPEKGDVLTVIDLQGSPVEILTAALAAAKEPLYVVTPVSRSDDLWSAIEDSTATDESASTGDNHKMDSVWRTFFHLDPSEIKWDDLSTALGLSVYNITK